MIDILDILGVSRILGMRAILYGGARRGQSSEEVSHPRRERWCRLGEDGSLCSVRCIALYKS